MAYRVRIEGIDVNFDFVNIDDALNFESMAAEYGKIEDYHHELDENSAYVRVSDGLRPVVVSFAIIEEAANE